MLTEETFHTSSSDTPPPKQPKNMRRIFSLKEKRVLLRKYDLVKESMSILQFTAKNGIPRRTFRNWLLNRSHIFDADRHSNLTRFKQRNSELPELDALLYEWFIDFKKRLSDIPISRDLLLKQAHRLKTLLETPIQQFQSPVQHQSETDEESSSDETTTGIISDFEFSADMFVDSFTLFPQSLEPPQQESSSPIVFSYKGISNPSVRCYANAIVQQLYYLSFFSQAVLDIPITQAKQTYCKKIVVDLKQIFQDLNPTNSKVSSAETGKLISDLKSPIGEAYVEGQQYDAAEFFDHLLTALDADSYSQNQTEPLRNLLLGLGLGACRA